MLPEKMTMTKNNKNKSGNSNKWPTILLFVIFLLTAAAAIYISIYYRADETAWRYMQSDATVTVLDTEYGWLFDGPSEDTALVFYPGAKVEEESYAPLLHSLAENGIDVCMVKMPFRLACLDGDAASEVLNAHNYSNWFIGGHSLGGLMAADYASDHAGDFSGVILLGAYPIEDIPDPLSEILIVGSEDHVVNWKKIESGRAYAPSDYVEYVINGGNHAQFGSYGHQRGDGIATVSAGEQVSETVNVIVNNL